jgi:hypothetical protein
MSYPSQLPSAHTPGKGVHAIHIYIDMMQKAFINEMGNGVIHCDADWCAVPRGQASLVRDMRAKSFKDVFLKAI